MQCDVTSGGEHEREQQLDDTAGHGGTAAAGAVRDAAATDGVYGAATYGGGEYAAEREEGGEGRRDAGERGEQRPAAHQVQVRAGRSSASEQSYRRRGPLVAEWTK